MKTWFFSAKSLLRAPLFWILLALLLLLPPVLSGIGEKSGLPASYYVVEDPADPDSHRMADFLKQEGFIELPDEETLRKGLLSGEFDAGAVIPGNLTARLEANDLDGLIRILYTPTTMFPNLKREEITTALFAVYAPYVTARALEGTEYTLKDVQDEYYRRMGDISTKVFTFDFILEGGEEVPKTDTGRRFFLGALAILLYLALYFAVVGPVWERFRSIEQRIGTAGAVKTVLLPGLAIRTGLFLLGAVLATILAGRPEFVLPAILYTLFVTLIHLVFSMLPGSNWKDIVILLFAAFSLVLCPIYLDLALLFKPIGVFRYALPPYYLWLFSGL